MKRIRITLWLVILSAIATLSFAARAAAQTVVVGTGNPDIDVPAVQAAVDQGGDVVLKGHFSFDRSPTIPTNPAGPGPAMVLVSKAVAISGAGDGHDAGAARLAVVGRDGRGPLEKSAARLLALGALENGVAPRHAPHVKPEIRRPGHLEGQPLVVRVGPPGQDRPPVLQPVLEGARGLPQLEVPAITRLSVRARSAAAPQGAQTHTSSEARMRTPRLPKKPPTPIGETTMTRHGRK